MRRSVLYICLLLLGASLAVIAASKVLRARARYDLVILNGRIVDGTGAAAFRADVGIRDGLIVKVGQIPHDAADRLIDADGLVVAPGFIDIHTHAEQIFKAPAADNFVHMGVTTVITGNCGSSAVEVERFLDAVGRGRPAVNVGTLIGHGSVRSKVMGQDDRAPTRDELNRMEEIVARGMDEGAFGLSTGLIYTPGAYAGTDELVALARVSASRGGIYATHIRDEGPDVFAAISEAINIGEQAGVPVEISHLKITSRNLWNKSDEALRLVSAARGRGLAVTVDQYAYTASSTSLDVLLPEWVRAGGREEAKSRLADGNVRERVVGEMVAQLRREGFEDYSFAVISRYDREPRLNGKSVAEVARVARGGGLREQIEFILELYSNGGAGMIYHKMSEDDVRRIMGAPFTMIASDSGIQKPDEGLTHPRGYGNNARVLGRYVRELRLLTLAEAVRRMTSLPAQSLGLKGRALIREGFAADLVIFDDRAISDLATFEQPRQYAAGIRYVLVNGDEVIADGQQTEARPGVVIRRNEPSRWRLFQGALAKLLRR